jgi:hypothetical protein
MNYKFEPLEVKFLQGVEIMKYKFEPFKDRRELFLWAAEGKPLYYYGALFHADKACNYDISFKGSLSDYQKAIEVKTQTVEFWVNFYKGDSGGAVTYSYDYEQEAVNDAKAYRPKQFIKTEKFTTEIEV